MVVIQFQRPFIKNATFKHPFAASTSQRTRKFSLLAQATPSRTQRIMESISVSGEVGGAGGAYSYNALKRLDQLWSRLCTDSSVVEEPQQVVSSFPGVPSDSELTEKSVDRFDVVVCGGTLGIFIATALSLKGLHVAIVERNVLKGREQEWNISRKELLELVEVGILTEDDIDQATSCSFNPNRCGFEGKGEVWVEDILNLGILPAKLVEIMKARFGSLGGVILEGYSVSSIRVYDDAAVLQLAEGRILCSRLVIDAMGNFSPIVKQIRRGRKPDGVCLVVGSCSRGFENNSTSDVIYSNKSVKKVGESEVQYFWEAFPAGSGSMDRTTYMFTYVDPQPGSPKLEDLLEDYWELMPHYQAVSLDNLKIMRVVFGIFPTYQDSPLPSGYNRVLQFGDASGIQSPVSFGGFGSLTRHLGRLTRGIKLHAALRTEGHHDSFNMHSLNSNQKCIAHEVLPLYKPKVAAAEGDTQNKASATYAPISEAMDGDFLDSQNLSLLNPYMTAMSAKKQSNVSPDFINELLYANFQSMQKLGDPVLRPFLQDVIQFGPFVKTLGLVMLTKPQILPSIFKQVGIPVLLDWSGHFFMLGFYTFLSTFIDPAIRPLVNTFPAQIKFKWKRELEAWKYGAGLDYQLSYSKRREMDRTKEIGRTTFIKQSSS